MPLTRTQIAPPAEDPATLAEVKTHLRVTDDADDTLIASLIKAATHDIEQRTERQLVNATFELRLDAFPGVRPRHREMHEALGRSGTIRLYPTPVQSVSKIEYLDPQTGDTLTLDAAKYRVDTDSEPARITEAWGHAWPEARDVTGAVTVTYVAGYGAAANVPEALKSAVMLRVELLYDRPAGADRIALERAIDDLVATHGLQSLR